MMPDREKVIMALELHRAGKCQDTNRQLCPYWERYDDCYKQMADDILSLLKEQKEVKEQFIEAFNTIRDAYNAPENREKILLNYLARNSCCCEQKLLNDSGQFADMPAMQSAT